MIAESMALVAQLLLAAVFIAAGVSKLRAPSALAGTLGALLSTPLWARVALARCVGVAELAVAAWLASGVALAAAAVVASTVLALFVGLLALLARVAPGAPCGCFGESDRRAGVMSGILRNFALIAAGVLLAFEASGRPSGVAAYVGALTVTVGVVTAYRLVVVAIEERAQLFSPVR